MHKFMQLIQENRSKPDYAALMSIDTAVRHYLHEYYMHFDRMLLTAAGRQVGEACEGHQSGLNFLERRVDFFGSIQRDMGL